MDNLKQISLFRSLTDKELEELYFCSKEVIFRKKEMIIKHGNMPLAVAYVSHGLVKMYDEYPGNRKHILHIIKSNEFIDVFSVFSELPYHFSASALIDTKVIMFERNVIKNIAAKNPVFASNTLRYLSVLSIFLLRNVIDLYCKNLKGRIAYFLLFLSRDVFYSQRFIIPVSRQEIADFSSMSRENISRTLHEFHKEGIIKIENEEIQILNEALLEKISDFG